MLSEGKRKRGCMQERPKLAKVISFREKRIEKLKKEYMNSDDIQRRLDSLMSSEAAIDRLLKDLNVNEENKERIRKLREQMKKDADNT